MNKYINYKSINRKILIIYCFFYIFLSIIAISFLIQKIPEKYFMVIFLVLSILSFLSCIFLMKILRFFKDISWLYIKEFLPHFIVTSFLFFLSGFYPINGETFLFLSSMFIVIVVNCVFIFLIRYLCLLVHPTIAQLSRVQKSIEHLNYSVAILLLFSFLNIFLSDSDEYSIILTSLTFFFSIALILINNFLKIKINKKEIQHSGKNKNKKIIQIKKQNAKEIFLYHSILFTCFFIISIVFAYANFHSKDSFDLSLSRFVDFLSNSLYFIFYFINDIFNINNLEIAEEQKVKTFTSSLSLFSLLSLYIIRTKRKFIQTLI